MFRYKEDKIIEDIENYVKSTYGQHYVAEAKGSQVIDIWEANGSLQSTARDTACGMERRMERIRKIY